MVVDSLRPRFGCIAGAEVLQAVALLLAAGIPRLDAGCLMPTALMAEGKDTIVAVVSLTHAGALHSIGNVTSRAVSSTQRLLCQPYVAPDDAQVPAGHVPCDRRDHCGCGSVLRHGGGLRAGECGGDETRGFWRGGVGLLPGRSACWEGGVPPCQSSPLRGGGSSESRFVQSP